MKLILQASAIEYLRYEAACKLVCMERSPWMNDPCTPDIIGVDKHRNVLEIEIKVSWADFKRNRKKDSMFRRRFLGIGPAKFHFMVPPELVERCRGALEEGEGLMSIDTTCNPYTGVPKAYVVVKAPFNKTRKLRLKEIVHMVGHQTGTLTRVLSKLVKCKAALREAVDYEI